MGTALAKETRGPYEHGIRRNRGQEREQQSGGRLKGKPGQNAGQSEDLAKSSCPNNTGK